MTTHAAISLKGRQQRLDFGPSPKRRKPKAAPRPPGNPVLQALRLASFVLESPEEQKAINEYFDQQQGRGTAP